MTDTHQEIAVSQEAREAAADFSDAEARLWSMGDESAHSGPMRRGERDDSLTVQAFAAFEHRIASTRTPPDGEVEARAKAAALKSLRWAGVTVLEQAVEKFHADDLNNHRGHLSRYMAGRYLDAFLAARLALTDPPNLPPGD